MRPVTKVRIEQAIERLGYTPNRLVRQLKSGYAPIIGLIAPSVANPF
jgi:DNA-binding LacI/PurR family transcriptional regulator